MSGQPAVQARVRLSPKEHGAYAILMVPVFSSLAISGCNTVALGVAVASIAGFFAHEPLLVTLGHRGARAKRLAPQAKPRSIKLIAVAGIAGALAMAGGDDATRAALIGCLLAAAVSFALAVAGKHKTLGGQLFGVIGLSAPSVAIVSSSGLSVSHALVIWSVWLVGFTSTTLAVRGVIAAQKRRPRLLYWSALSVTTPVTFAGPVLGNPLTLAALPMVVGAWGLMFFPPPAKYLKRVGWTLVAVTLATALIVVLLNNASPHP